MSAIRYSADPPSQLRSVELDGLTALFHLPSGTTHILAAPAPQILHVLARGPASAATILTRLKRHFDLGDAVAAGEAMTARLSELEQAGLVRRA